MKGLSQGTELLRFSKDTEDSEWYVAQLAINGILATTFSVGTPVVYSFLEKGEEALAQYLERQASSLIERYGDARSPRPDPVMLNESTV